MPSAKARRTAGKLARPALSPTDWARAALAAIGRGGLAAVAVEPLAAELGTTKGSFYWHFASRDALLEAALRLWETEHTEHVIAAMSTEPDPAARLRRLFIEVTDASIVDRTEIALLVTAGHPRVAAALRRVTERRIEYVRAQFEQLGLAPAEARNRALLAFTAWLGYVQLAHSAPAVLPAGAAARRRYLNRALDILELR